MYSQETLHEEKLCSYYKYVKKTVLLKKGLRFSLWLSGSENWDPFSEGPEKFSDPESYNKNIKLKVSEQFLSHIFNMNKFCPHAKFHAYTLLCFLRYRYM